MTNFPALYVMIQEYVIHAMAEVSMEVTIVMLVKEVVNVRVAKEQAIVVAVAVLIMTMMTVGQNVPNVVVLVNATNVTGVAMAEIMVPLLTIA